MALAGVALLIGPTLGVLWPREGQSAFLLLPRPMVFASSLR